MTFYPAEDRISVRTYSPWLDTFRNDPCLDGNSCHEFELAYDMEQGIPAGGCERVRIPERGEAIRAAIAAAAPGDTVLIAGKGHETYQVLKDSVVPFDDRHEAARALSAKEAGWLHR